VRENSTPTFFQETELNNGRTKQNELRARWSNHDSHWWWWWWWWCV